MEIKIKLSLLLVCEYKITGIENLILIPPTQVFSFLQMKNAHVFGNKHLFDILK